MTDVSIGGRGAGDAPKSGGVRPGTAGGDGGPGGNGGKRRASLGSQEAEEIFATFDQRVLQRLLVFVGPHRRQLLWAIAAVCGSTVSGLAMPWIIQQAVSSAVTFKDAHRLDMVLIGFVGIVILSTTAFYLENYVTQRLAQKVIFDLRRSMFARFQDISLSFMDKTHVGRIMSRLQGDVDALQQFLEQGVGALGDLLSLTGIIAILLMMDFKLGLLTLVVLPLLVAIRTWWTPYTQRGFMRSRIASAAQNGAFAENINGIRTVQAMRREAVNFELFEERARENFEAQRSAAWMQGVMAPVVDVLTGLAMAIIIVVGGAAVLGGRLNVGVMVAFVFYVQRFFEPVRMLSMQYTTMMRAMAAGARILEVLDVPITIQNKPGAIDLPNQATAVEFKNVTFAYTPGRPVLHNISLKVNPREVVALVGPTGSGKTSITSLTHRFYEVDEGQVLVGGHDVRDLTLESLGRNIAMVLQEPFLFSGTVLENIRYATSGASRDDIIAAAKAVRAHDFIIKLPEGYESQLGQRGCNLSLGQRQLLSFARALVANPQILILDEATANIDSFTEQDIQKALKVLFAGRTCLVVAHRLGTIRDADRIIVLQQGRIIEQGPHDELMARGGRQQTVEMLGQRRLTRAVLTHDGDPLARSDVEVDATDGCEPIGIAMHQASDADADVARDCGQAHLGRVDARRRRREAQSARVGPRDRCQGRRDRGLIEGVRRCHAGSLREPHDRRRQDAQRRHGPAAEGDARHVKADTAAFLEEQAAVGRAQQGRFLLHTQHGAAIASRLKQQRRDGRGPSRVELRGVLVEHQHARAHDQDAGDGHALLLPARKLQRRPIGEVCDAQVYQHRIDACIHLGTWNSQVLQPEGEFLADALLGSRELVGRCREDDAHAARDLGRRCGRDGDATHHGAAIDARLDHPRDEATADERQG
jgi:ATP-binding cassette subfamily B multidrug efflux pump